MAIHDEAACFGYFGFGDGYELSNRRLTPGPAAEPGPLGVLYCHAACPHGLACWAAHRGRVRELFPDLMLEMDRLVALHRAGPAVVQAWWDLYGSGPPDLVVMAGNLEDGLAVAASGAPKERGAGSLTWPLTPISPKES